MKVQKLFTFMLLVFIAAFSLYALEDQKFSFEGELLGMYTLGTADEDQVIGLSLGSLLVPVGIYDRTNHGMNGYMTRMDFNIRYLPFDWAELFVQFRARSRVGSPYIPLMLEAASDDNFSISFEQAWGRADLISGLGFDSPLGLFVKAGFFDTAPESYQLVSRFGTENVVNRIRLGLDLSVQLSAVYSIEDFATFSLVGATKQSLNEAIQPVYDSDGSMGLHGEPTIEELYALPLFVALRMQNLNTGLGGISTEIFYALNADGVYSGHNFGASFGWELEIPNGMVLPLGLAVGLTEKNIDPLARAGHKLGNRNALFSGDGLNDEHLMAYLSTVSFRRSLRVGAGAGLVFSPIEILTTEINFGYAYSQIAHIYRDTLTLNSASVDMRVTLHDKFFLGGGLFFGSLTDAEWKSRETLLNGDPNPETNFNRVFSLAENMGFEIHAGLYLGPGSDRTRSRFVLGYNQNKGLSMNHGIEAMSEAQVIHLQSGSTFDDNLFQTGGFFAKLIMRW